MYKNDTSRPGSGFTPFDLGPSLQRAVVRAGWSEPRPIQHATLPAALEGRDVLGLAQTGTGKTAAFALPILERLLRTRGHGPRALIVAPTRELASQTHDEITMLATGTPITAVSIYGGVSQGRQVRDLRKHPDIVVACPGRLLDLMQQGHVKLHRIETLVLDEADHMFDMGFLPDIRRILKALPRKRQNLLFSATMPRQIRALADSLLNDPEVAELGHSAPADTVEHALYPIPGDQKLRALKHLLGDAAFDSAIVFSRTKHRAKRLAKQLSGAGHDAVALQGNMSQGQRERAMKGFRDGRYTVLVATDIAARGLDISRVSHVINFDIPATPDAYTHRIGRTGRAERSGEAFTLVTPDNIEIVHAIERKLGITIDRRRIPGFETFSIPQAHERHARPAHPARRSKRSRGGRGRRRRR